MTASISSNYMPLLPQSVKGDLHRRFSVIVNQLKLSGVTLYPVKIAGERCVSEAFLGGDVEGTEMSVQNANFRVCLHAAKMLILCEIVFTDNLPEELRNKYKAGLMTFLKKGIKLKSDWYDRVEKVLLGDTDSGTHTDPSTLANSPDISSVRLGEDSDSGNGEPKVASKVWFMQDKKRLALACLALHENSNCIVTAPKAIAQKLELEEVDGLLQSLNLAITRDLVNSYGLIRKSAFKRNGKVHYTLTTEGEDLIVSKLGSGSIKKTVKLNTEETKKRLLEINDEQIALAAMLTQASSGSSPEADTLVAEISQERGALEAKVKKLLEQIDLLTESAEEIISEKEASLEEIRSGLNDQVSSLKQSLAELEAERNRLLGLG